MISTQLKMQVMATFTMEFENSLQQNVGMSQKTIIIYKLIHRVSILNNEIESPTNIYI